MGTIRKEIITTAKPETAWAAIRDVGALHTKLVPGFVIDTKLEGDVRLVTFGNGNKVREPIVSIEEGLRRLVWSSEGSQLSHYNSSLQVFEDKNGSRIVWTADFLPNSLSDFLNSMIEKAAATMKATLDK